MERRRKSTAISIAIRLQNYLEPRIQDINTRNYNTLNVAESDSLKDFFGSNFKCITEDEDEDELFDHTLPNDEQHAEAIPPDDDTYSDSEIDTTVMIPTQTTPESPENNQMEWKIISLIFIALSVALFIVSIFLWRALPSKQKNTPNETFRGFRRDA